MRDIVMKKSRKWIWIGGALVLVIVAALLGLYQLRSSSAAHAETAMTGEIVSALVGDLSASATASGQVLAQRGASLAMSLSGIVAEVYVEVGDAVRAGESLVTLETAELERAVESARQALTIQEANLATLLAPPSAADLAAAESGVASARASLDELLDGPRQDEITAVDAEVRGAQADVASKSAQLNALLADASEEEIYAADLELDRAQRTATQAAEQHSTILVMEPSRFVGEGRLEDMEFAARTNAVQTNAALAAAQDALDQLLNGDPNAIASAQASLAIAVARQDASQAQLDLLLLGASEAQVSAAEASRAQAKATLDMLQRGPSPSQIAVAEIGVEQSRINLQRSENNLQKATLAAPFGGVITAIYVNQGEQASGILVEMLDTHSLEVVLDVDEVDIGEIAVGQPTVITLESWPEMEIEGQVVSIAPRDTSSNSAIVSYQVYVSLGETELPVLVGMTANADLMIAKQEDVLRLPNVAINVDRDAGTYNVNRVTADAAGNQTIEEVEVTIGLRDGQYTQITSGLQEGDQVMVGNAIPELRFGPGGGGGSRPPGMLFGRGG
jgi:HlyD family secretion protein